MDVDPFCKLKRLAYLVAYSERTTMRILKSTLLLAAAMTMSCTVMAKEIVLVAGATSLSGRAIVKSLLDQGYKVRAMVRDVAKAGDMGPGVQMVVADVTKPDLLKGAVKGRTMYCR